MTFEGTAQTDGKAVDPDAPFGTKYEFRVERVIQGDVRSSEQVRVLTGAGSMCGIGFGLLPRGSYRINASVFALPNGQRVLDVNYCSGSAQLLAAPPEEDSTPNAWPFIGAAVAAATAGIFLLSRRRRPPA